MLLLLQVPVPGVLGLRLDSGAPIDVQSDLDFERAIEQGGLTVVMWGVGAAGSLRLGDADGADPAP